MWFSVIIPAYNEEARLPQTLKKIDEYLREQNYSYEILVVDDGSKDKTKEVAESLRGKIRNLKVMGYKENKGKGYAVRKGILRARGEYRLFTDADNSISIEQIERFWPEFKKGFDMVTGLRVVRGAVLGSPQSLFRKAILARGFNLLRKIILNLREIKDTQCGFKCFKKEVAERIFPECKINGFAFDIEILILAKQTGFNIKELPVCWKNWPESKVRFGAMMEMSLDLLKMKKMLKQKNRQGVSKK